MATEKVREYVSTRKRQALRVVLLDDKGKPVPQLDGQGSPMFVQGKQVYKSRIIRFDQTLSNNAKLGYLVGYKTSDKADIEVLDAACEDPSNKIMRVEDYKKRQNPAQYEAEQRANALAKQLSESNAGKDALARKNTELEETIKQLEAKAKGK